MCCADSACCTESWSYRVQHDWSREAGMQPIGGMSLSAYAPAPHREAWPCMRLASGQAARGPPRWLHPGEQSRGGWTGPLCPECQPLAALQHAQRPAAAPGSPSALHTARCSAARQQQGSSYVCGSHAPGRLYSRACIAYCSAMLVHRDFKPILQALPCKPNSNQADLAD